MTQSITLLTTPELSCDYLPEQLATTRFVHPETSLNPVMYGALLEQGFRRSGNIIYEHACLNCQMCQSLKLDPASFTPSRSQRRCEKANSDLVVTPQKATFTEEYFELYSRYINTRHHDGEMANPTRESFKEFLISDWCSTLFVEMRLDGRLIGVSVVDIVPKGFSAVYTFFDPQESKRGLGTFAVLWQLKMAKKRSLPWVYLGYWIESHPKMDYKSKFRPAEVYRFHQWQPLEPTPPQQEECSEGL